MKYLKSFNESFDTKTFIEEIFVDITDEKFVVDVWETSEYIHIDIQSPNLFTWNDVKEDVLKLLNIVEFSKIKKVEFGKGAKIDYQLFKKGMGQHDRLRKMVNDEWQPEGNFGYLLIIIGQPIT